MDTACKRRNRVRTKISLQDFNQHTDRNKFESIFLLQKGLLCFQKLFRVFYRGAISGKKRDTVPHDFFFGRAVLQDISLYFSAKAHLPFIDLLYNWKGANTLPQSKTHSTARCSIKHWPPTHCHVSRGCH